MIEAFSFGDHFVNSHNLFSRLCIDLVRRKLMLVTQEFKSLKVMLHEMIPNDDFYCNTLSITT